MRWGRSRNTGKPPLAVPLPTLPQGRNSIADFIPVARIADMLLHPGEAFDYDGQRLTYPDIRLVYWAGGNPFHHHQDLDRLRDAFARPDTVIVHEFGLDRDRAPRRHRAAGDDHAGARRYRRLGRRPAAGGDAPRGRRPMREARDDYDDLRRARRAPRRSASASPRAARRGNGSNISTSRPAARLPSAASTRPISHEFWEDGRAGPADRSHGTAASSAPSATTPRPRRCRRRAARSRSPRQTIAGVRLCATAPATRPGCRRRRRDAPRRALPAASWSPTSRRRGCTASSISARPASPRRSSGREPVRIHPARRRRARHRATAISCASTTIAAPASPARC